MFFFVKDDTGRYVAARPELLRRSGFSEEHRMIGRTDPDIYPAPLADAYVRDDLQVLPRLRVASCTGLLAAKIKVLLLVVDGVKTDREIAALTGLSQSEVARTKLRFEIYGLPGLIDA